MTELVTVGWLTMDDIVLPDHSCRHGILGGGALYSAIGAQIWTPDVGIHAVTGRRHVETVRRAIAARGIDARGVTAMEGNGLELWLLHEGDESKQQVPKLTSSPADEVDEARGPLLAAYETARGFHIAPQSPASSLANAARLGRLSARPVVTMDLLSDTFIDRRLYRDLGFLRDITAFLPSEAEVSRIWNPPDLRIWLREQSVAHGCHLAAKLGEQGSLVCHGRTGDLYHVPAVPARVVDTTGAGDAYCGGFIAGLVAGRDIAECAAMGTVSASYVVEACGALETARPANSERDRRLKAVMSKIERIDV
jgi:sugar/nucleoside kinase (ribokinase family)